MSKKRIKERIESAGKQLPLPGHKESELQGFARTYLLAKESFSEGSDKLKTASEELAVAMKTQNIPTFLCEGIRITLKITDAKVKVVSAPEE